MIFWGDKDPSIGNESNYHNLYKGLYKTPLSINLGAAYTFNKVDIAVSGEWFSKINKYQLQNKIKIFNNESKMPSEYESWNQIWSGKRIDRDKTYYILLTK